MSEPSEPLSVAAVSVMRAFVPEPKSGQGVGMVSLLCRSIREHPKTKVAAWNKPQKK